MNSQIVKSGETFSLHVGQGITIANTEISWEFVEIVEDTRCPQQGNCDSPGSIIVKLENIFREGENGKKSISSTGDGKSIYQLSVSGKGGEMSTYIVVGGYKFSILKIEPYPDTWDQPIEQADYVLRVKIEKTDEPDYLEQLE